MAEDYPSENRDFVTANSIKHVQISIPANKDAFDSIPLESMAKALVTICDKRNHPVLVHCNKGKVCKFHARGWRLELN